MTTTRVVFLLAHQWGWFFWYSHVLCLSTEVWIALHGKQQRRLRSATAISGETPAQTLCFVSFNLHTKKNHVAHCNQRASVFIRILSCVNRCMFCVFTYMRSFEQHFGWRRLEPLFHLSYYTLMQKSSQVLICVCNNILNIETVSMW